MGFFGTLKSKFYNGLTEVIESTKTINEYTIEIPENFMTNTHVLVYINNKLSTPNKNFRFENSGDKRYLKILTTELPSATIKITGLLKTGIFQEHYSYEGILG